MDPRRKFVATSEDCATAEECADAINQYMKLSPKDQTKVVEMIETFFVTGNSDYDLQDEDSDEERGAVVIYTTIHIITIHTV